MRIHIPAPPHTRPTAAFSHCAFTTKALLLPRVLRAAYPSASIVWYGVGEDRPDGCTEHVPCLTDAQWTGVFGGYDLTKPGAFVGDQANVEHPGYVQFNAALSVEWAARVAPGDLVCFPFGHAHGAAAPAAQARGGVCVETGIGYPTPFLPFRIYESAAWQHFVAGRLQESGSDYHFVVPHYYDLTAWPTLAAVADAPRAREVIYLGRLIESKGLRVVRAMADVMPDVSFVLYGQGDPSPYVGGNVRYGGVLHGDERAAALLSASAAIFPTRYIEPFCQAHIEALLCGTPVVGSIFGVFPETRATMARHTEYGAVHCARTLEEFADGTWAALDIDAHGRALIARAAQRTYGLNAVAVQYRNALDVMLATATLPGWYGRFHSSLSTPQAA